MNDLMPAPMPRMQPAIQAALVPGQSQPNLLQAPPQAAAPPPALAPAISPQQVQDAHAHLSDMQQTIAELLKKPDSELSIKQIFRAAADMVTKHQINGGKKGISAAAIASELASPDFPKNDDKGTPPPPEAIRKFLQQHFDNSVLNQAKLTQHFGPAIPHIDQQAES